jgi:hypothetical protein
VFVKALSIFKYTPTRNFLSVSGVHGRVVDLCKPTQGLLEIGDDMITIDKFS